MDDPLVELNPRPANIVETNKLPIIFGIVILVVGVIVLLFRQGPAPSKDENDAPQVAVVDHTENSAKQFWFHDDAHKNLQIDPLELSSSPQVEKRQEKAFQNAQEVKQKQAVIELDYANKIELAQIENKYLLEEKELTYAALKSPLGFVVDSKPPARTASAVVELDGTTGRFSESGAGLASLERVHGDAGSDLNRQDAKRAFLQQTMRDEEYLPNKKRRPLSPYELKAGTYIPAALVTGIQSDLPGPIVAQVTSDVYDTASGQFLLIPQGAKLVGEYDSHVSFGQNRALVVWTRLIFPDGATLNLSRMQGVDMAGFAGFYDRVDNHYLRIYGNAFLLSLVGAGYDLLNKTSEKSGNVSARDTVAASVGQRLADVSSQTMERNLNVQPTILIRPGYLFNIIVVKDVILEDVSHDVEGS